MNKQTVAIPTKTRPKKLIFLGSDGNEYPFLFKGQEDLHLDERIMQLIHTCNLMLSQKDETWPPFSAQNYCVTPLGSRSGLIQWVDGATTLLHIYRKWQARKSAFKNPSNPPTSPCRGMSGFDRVGPTEFDRRRGASGFDRRGPVGYDRRGGQPGFEGRGPSGIGRKMAPGVDRKEAGDAELKENFEVDRPIGIFFKKLRAAFEASKISLNNLANRQCWPHKILREVFKELLRETPHDLLYRELWLRTGSPNTWHRVTERFARSTAVMSVLGSILGLGDRHLDNVMVNLGTGYIVHIDYNVCFDKGRQLRVPETVPFRLTGNIVNALGPTQVEGTFRLSCEHVMAKLRAGREVLLTILDTFVYDPLVDWAAAQDHLVTSNVNVSTLLAVYGNDAAPDTASSLARSLFLLRIKEFATLWHMNGDYLQHALTRVTSALEKKQLAERGLLLDYRSKLKGRPAADQTKMLDKERVEAGLELKQAIQEHHQLMQDIRPLLRSLARTEERFRNYLYFYKTAFSDPLVQGHALLDNVSNDVAGCVTMFRNVSDRLNSVYEGLVDLGKPDGRKSSSPLSNTASPSLRSTPVSRKSPSVRAETAEASSTPPPKKTRQKQEQNKHAKNISRRVRQKLEGKDPFIPQPTSSGTTKNEEKKALTPAEQVDALIRQATSHSNLALMYEGWTAWV